MRISDWSSDVCSSDLLLLLTWLPSRGRDDLRAGHKRIELRNYSIRDVYRRLIRNGCSGLKHKVYLVLGHGRLQRIAHFAGNLIFDISMGQCDGHYKCCQFLLTFGAPLLESSDLRLQRRIVSDRSLLRLLEVRTLLLGFLVQSGERRMEKV